MYPVKKETSFGTFDFVDAHTVIASAHEAVEIDAAKVKHAIELIEETFDGDYALVLNRRSDYSVMPMQVYQFFSAIPRLRAIAIVRYNRREMLPDDMEMRLFDGPLQKFSTLEDACAWVKTLFSDGF